MKRQPGLAGCMMRALQMECIDYKAGYRYQLVNEYSIVIPITPNAHIERRYITLLSSGRLTINEGYAWDGPSGPAFDTLNFMRASLVHDALYQLMREGELDARHHRLTADKLLRQLCKEDGMSPLRAWWVYQGARFGGGPAASPAEKRVVIRAPGSC